MINVELSFGKCQIVCVYASLFYLEAGWEDVIKAAVLDKAKGQSALFLLVTTRGRILNK